MSIPKGFVPIENASAPSSIPEGFVPQEDSFINNLGRAFAMQAQTSAPSPQAQAEVGSALLSGATLGTSKRLTEKLLPEKRAIPPVGEKLFETVGEFLPISGLQHAVTKGAAALFPKSAITKALSTIGGMSVAGAGYNLLKDNIEEGKQADITEDIKSGAIWGGIESVLQAIPYIGSKAKQLVDFAKKEAPTSAESLAAAVDKSADKLELPKVVEREGRPFTGLVPPKAFPKDIEKTRSSLGEQAQNIIEKIKKEKLPISEEIESGVNVDARNEELFDKVTEIAKTIPEKPDIKPISDWLKTKKEEIKSLPRKTDENELFLKLIDKESSHFMHEEGGVSYHSFPELISIFRSYNADAKDAYKSWIRSGSQESKAKKNFYTGINKEISKLIEEKAPKELSEPFKFSNQQFSQARKLEELDQKLSSFEKDGSLNIDKFFKHVSNPKNKNFYINKIDNEGYNRLKILASDLRQAQDNLSLIQKIDLPGIIKSGVTWGLLAKILPYKIVLPVKIAKEATSLIRGYMYLSPQGFKDTHNFLNAIKSGSITAITDSLRKLDKDAEDYSSS